MLKDIANAQEDEHYRKIEEEKVKAMMIAEGGLAGTKVWRGIKNRRSGFC